MLAVYRMASGKFNRKERAGSGGGWHRPYRNGNSGEGARPRGAAARGGGHAAGREMQSHAPRRWRGGAMGTSRPTATGHERGARQRDTSVRRGVRRGEGRGAWVACAKFAGVMAVVREPGGPAADHRAARVMRWIMRVCNDGAHEGRGMPSHAPRRGAAVRAGRPGGQASRPTATGHERGARRGRGEGARRVGWRGGRVLSDMFYMSVCVLRDQKSLPNSCHCRSKFALAGDR